MRNHLLALTCLVVTMLAASNALPSAHGLETAAVSNVADKLGRRFQRTLLREGSVTGIIVLGGGASRAHAAVALARDFPDAVVILSGPGRSEEAIMSAESDLQPRLIIDRRAQNTYENATLSKSLAQPKANERWLLVTSAMHMPRSIGAFRSVGFEVEPWPVHDVEPPSPLAKSVVKHEVLGLVYYRLLGRSAALFPRPA